MSLEIRINCKSFTEELANTILLEAKKKKLIPLEFDRLRIFLVIPTNRYFIWFDDEIFEYTSDNWQWLDLNKKGVDLFIQTIEMILNHVDNECLVEYLDCGELSKQKFRVETEDLREFLQDKHFKLGTGIILSGKMRKTEFSKKK